MTTRRDLLKQTVLGGAALSLLSPRGALARGGRFGVDGDQFVLDGKPFQILAGEMHYPRIPRSCWRDRMRKLKALGLNTLTTYCFWNAHEKHPGQWDFSGGLDVAAYVRLAQEEGLWVNLRPGPYVCAEWDGGGLPAWLFADPTVKARSLDPRFLAPVRAYFKRLGQELTPLLIDRGGPIILTQVENEYGSFGQDHVYMATIKGLIEAAGFDGMLYTADGAAVMEGGMLPGVQAGINFGANDVAPNEFATLAKHRPDGPRFCSEFWTGWFDHMGETHAVIDAKPMLQNFDWMLSRKTSISFYMLHGGTSFGFDAGANFDKVKGYQPDISSYDYDALLDEAGRPTPKFFEAQKLLLKYAPAGTQFPPLPAPETGVSIARFHLSETASLQQLLVHAKHAETPQTFEALGQNQGLVVYRHPARKALKGKLSFENVRDYAVVSSNGERIGALDRRFNETSLDIDLPRHSTLEVLVAAWGHINYGPLIGQDQKGLSGAVTLDGAPLTGWEHYAVPLDDLQGLKFAAKPVQGPAFYRGQFTLAQTGYSFLDLRGWGKGYVWVNGRNIGRYVSAGPQRALFVPAEILKAGANDIVVLDLDSDGDRTLAGGLTQIWDRPGVISA